MAYKSKEKARAYRRQHYQENKQYYKDKARDHNIATRTFMTKLIDRYKVYKGCVDCGYKENPKALQFDHITGDKFMAVSDMIKRCYGKSRIKEEIAKCEVRCANCHAIVTHLRLSKI